jgi:tRNA threonylcarbamoyladenosine biosynthesis protein TsaB
MSNPLILHMETATDRCSVALSEGDELLAQMESGPERSHAKFLNRYIRETISAAGKELQEIDAVAVSKGPGSYTGLRIGVSTAKGIAYALGKPLLAVGTLENMAYGALKNKEIGDLADIHGPGLLLCPMLDARRMEVYSVFYSPGLKQHRSISADIIEESSYREILDSHQVCFFGNGSVKCRGTIDHPHAHFIDWIYHSSKQMIKPALERYGRGHFEDVAYFEPFYLKDFIATRPRKKVL